MAFSNVSAVTSHFPTANEGFSTTTSGSVSSGGSTVGLNSVSGLTNGTVFVGVIEPGEVKQQVFTGIVDTGGSQITGVVWTRGDNVAHATGVSVVDYDTGTSSNMVSKGARVSLDQDGTLKAGAVDNAAALASNVVTTAKILDENVTTAKIDDDAVTSAKAAAGFVVQQVEYQTGSSVTTAGERYSSAGVLTWSTGKLAMTATAITPKSATNTLVVNVLVNISSPTTQPISIALFNTTSGNAAAQAQLYATQGSGLYQIPLIYTQTAGSTSPITFYVRMGANGDEVTMNGLSGVGSTYSGISIKEIKA